MKLSVGMEVVLTTCQYLMAVSLMAHIPHNAVVGGVEHVVQGYGKRIVGATDLRPDDASRLDTEYCLRVLICRCS